MEDFDFKKKYLGNSLVVEWLGLHAFTAEGAGLIPGWGIRIPQATQRGQKEKKTWMKSKTFKSMIWGTGKSQIYNSERFRRWYLGVPRHV